MGIIPLIGASGSRYEGGFPSNVSRFIARSMQSVFFLRDLAHDPRVKGTRTLRIRALKPRLFVLFPRADFNKWNGNVRQASSLEFAL